MFLKFWDMIRFGEDGASGGQAAGDPPTQPGKTFTQEQLDAIIADRLTRERTKFADYEALKTKASKFDEIEQANLSDLEKIKIERDEAVAQVAQAKQLAAISDLRANVLTKLSGFKTEDGSAFRTDAHQAVIKLLIAEHDAKLLDGTFDLDKAITSLAKDNPFLMQQPQEADPKNKGRQGGGPTSVTNGAGVQGGSGLTDEFKSRLLGKSQGGDIFEAKPDGLRINNK